MSPSELKDVLAWSIGINYAILFLWFGVFVNAHDWVYRMHARWFRLSEETFDAINYAAVAAYKIGIVLLNVVPYIALHLSRT